MPRAERVGVDARQTVRAIWPSAVGAALLLAPSRHFDILQWSAPRSLDGDVCFSLVYATSVAIMTVGWLRAVRHSPSVGVAMAAGLSVHSLALLSRPFLSLDSLCYAAIGRAMAQFHASAFAPLAASLPANDRFLALLPEPWALHGSAYFPAFNELAKLIAVITRDDLAAAIRGHQLAALAAMGSAALATAKAVEARAPADAGRAALFVLLCPLSIVEATVNAHNDAFLAASVAFFAFAVATRRRSRGIAALLVAVLIKASALLVLLVTLVESVGRQVSRTRKLAVACVSFSAVAVTAVVWATTHVASLRVVLALIGDPASAPHCTRSIECIPRAFLYWEADSPQAAWWLGLAFRIAGAAWLAFAGYRAARAERGESLRRLAAALFIYYLWLHGFMQTWYLLPLVPLLPFASGHVRLCASVFCVASLSYYVIRLPLEHDVRLVVIAIKELCEGVVAIVPPTVLLLWRKPTICQRRRLTTR